jgi:hypothetical protein
MLSSGAPSLHVPTNVGPLSDSDKETKRYLERILSGVAMKSPFAQISPITEVLEKYFGLELGGTRDTEATITKDVLASIAGRGEL